MIQCRWKTAKESWRGWLKQELTESMRLRNVGKEVLRARMKLIDRRKDLEEEIKVNELKKRMKRARKQMKKIS